MLSLRMIIFAGIAGICLFGLSTLLDSLKEPALLRTQQGIAVKGCGSLDTHKDSPRLCPALLCQKALVDRKLVGLQDKVTIEKDATESDGRMIVGRITGKDQYFSCLVVGLTVKEAGLVPADEFESLSSP